MHLRPRRNIFTFHINNKHTQASAFMTLEDLIKLIEGNSGPVPDSSPDRSGVPPRGGCWAGPSSTLSVR
eukprot:2516318-Heterocapsa_arctica.AAC.1